MGAINHMMDQLLQTQDHGVNRLVDRRDYEQWARGFVFEGLRNQRYGQSFCNQFGIRDNILFFSSSVEEADRYIQKNYVR